jgi:hypothetical protein
MKHRKTLWPQEVANNHQRGFVQRLLQDNPKPSSQKPGEKPRQ